MNWKSTNEGRSTAYGREDKTRTLKVEGCGTRNALAEQRACITYNERKLRRLLIIRGLRYTGE